MEAKYSDLYCFSLYEQFRSLIVLFSIENNVSCPPDCFFTGYPNCHAYGLLWLKIFADVSVLLNYLNLYKINLWHIPFIIYGHHWKLCAQHLQFFCWKILNYFIYYFYIVYKLKYSMSQACINACQKTNVQKVEWRHSRFFKQPTFILRNF